MTIFKAILRYGCLLCALPWAKSAHAAADETDTWRAFVTESMGYDDNLFRLSGKLNPHTLLGPNMSKSDFINQLGAGGRFSYPLGRQLFKLDLRLDDNRYIHNSRLDNVSTLDKVSWQWALGRQWSGEIGYSYQRALAPFAYTQFFLKDIVSEHNAFIDLDYTWHPRWKLSAGVRWLDSIHDNTLRAYLDRENLAGLVGLSYTTPANNSVGVEYKLTEVDLPNRQITPASLIDNHYQVQTANLVLDWHVTGKTRLDGRLGFSSLENRQFSQRDFSGATWRATLEWTPTGKTQLSLSGWRELQPSQTLDASYMVVQGVSLSPVWNATAKLSVTAQVSWQSFDFAGDPGLVTGLGQRRDTLLTGRLALGYTPRNVEINLAYQAEQRDSNRRLADYTDNSVFASAKLRF